MYKTCIWTNIFNQNTIKETDKTLRTELDSNIKNLISYMSERHFKLVTKIRNKS